MRTATCLILALTLVGAGACGLITDPAEDERLGFVTGFLEGDPRITVPATATAGEPFTVQVRTYGPSGCWTKGRTKVTRLAGTAVVEPYDRDRSGDAGACTAALLLFEHTADLTFDQPGPVEVVVRGREGGTREVVAFSRVVEITE